MDCTQIRKRLSDPIAYHAPDVQSHIRECADCRSVYEAVHLARPFRLRSRTPSGHPPTEPVRLQAIRLRGHPALECLSQPTAGVRQPISRSPWLPISASPAVTALGGQSPVLECPPGAGRFPQREVWAPRCGESDKNAGLPAIRRTPAPWVDLCARVS